MSNKISACDYTFRRKEEARARCGHSGGGAHRGTNVFLIEAGAE